MEELGFQGDDNKLSDFVKAILEVGPTGGPGRSRPTPPFVMADGGQGRRNLTLYRPKTETYQALFTGYLTSTLERLKLWQAYWGQRPFRLSHQ